MVKVIKSHPGILRYDVKTRLEPHAEWLEGEGLTTRASIGKVLYKLPQVKNSIVATPARAVDSKRSRRNVLSFFFGGSHMPRANRGSSTRGC